MRDPGLPRKPRRVHRTFQEQNFNKFAPKEVSPLARSLPPSPSLPPSLPLSLSLSLSLEREK